MSSKEIPRQHYLCVLLSMEKWAVAKKDLSSFHILANGHLSWVSCHSCPWANDKGDNEMISGAVHRSPSIYITAEENLKLTDHLVTAV